MAKDTKILLGILLATFVGIAGLVIVLSKNATNDAEPTKAKEVEGVTVAPASYDLGNVPINGGKISKDYEIKNTTDKTIKVKKITTSCMCTVARIKVGDKESNFFGMEGMSGGRNPSINYEIPAGQSAVVTAVFDPAAHGPQGVGPFDRSVWVTFSDPGGIKDLKFNGVVTSQ